MMLRSGFFGSLPGVKVNMLDSDEVSVLLESRSGDGHTIKGKDLIIASDARVGDNIVDPARGRDVGGCLEEPHLVVPVGDIALYISGPGTVNIQCIIRGEPRP